MKSNWSWFWFSLSLFFAEHWLPQQPITPQRRESKTNQLSPRKQTPIQFNPRFHCRGIEWICFVCSLGLPPRFGLVGAALHSFRKREVAALFPFIVSFHFTIQFKSCLLSSFIHLRSLSLSSISSLHLFSQFAFTSFNQMENKENLPPQPARLLLWLVALALQRP